METVNHECYVSLEVAKLLKKAGFEWKCKTYYDISIYRDEIIIEDELRDYNFMNGSIIFSAPTLEVAQRWLREVKELNIEISTWPGALWRWVVWKINPDRRIIASKHQNYKSYEEALEAGIKEALEIILEDREVKISTS